MGEDGYVVERGNFGHIRLSANAQLSATNLAWIKENAWYFQGCVLLQAGEVLGQHRSSD